MLKDPLKHAERVAGYIACYGDRHTQAYSDTSARLPLLVSVPHGGYAIPAEISPFVNLDFKDIFYDSDPFTRIIYSFKDYVYSYHDSDIARAVVDLNRSAVDLPPENPDGVVKSHTVFNKKVYRDWQQPSHEKTQQLLDRYYYPYHHAIDKNMKDPALLCGLDCHTMLELNPDSANSSDKDRPFICLSNCGDNNGNGEQTSCDQDLIQLLAECLREQFPEEADEIVLNTPFKGGHITRFHSRKMPWIQIELNRRAYLQRPWFNPHECRVERQRLDYLRNKFLSALVLFCDEAESMYFSHMHNMARTSSTMVSFTL